MEEKGENPSFSWFFSLIFADKCSFIFTSSQPTTHRPSPMPCSFWAWPQERECHRKHMLPRNQCQGCISWQGNSTF